MKTAESLNEKRGVSKNFISKAFNKMINWAKKNPAALGDWVLASLKNNSPLIIRVDKEIEGKTDPSNSYVTEKDVRLMDEFKRFSNLLAEESVQISSIKLNANASDNRAIIELGLT
jgi:hypothetical protein